MRYSIAESLADYDFRFFEKIHEPILLVNRLGKVIKINEAGRKLACVTQTNLNQIESLIVDKILDPLKGKTAWRTKILMASLELKIVATTFKGSDYFLIEVKR